MTVEMPEGYFNIEVRDSENCWVVRMMPNGSIDINPKYTASEAGAEFVRVVREISGRTPAAEPSAVAVKALAEAIIEREFAHLTAAQSVSGPFICQRIREAADRLSTLAPSAAPTTDWQWIQPRLKEALETRSSREIAAEIGLGHATVCRIANGHEPSVSSYFAIVKWLSPRTTPADDNPFFTQGARNDIPIPTLKEMIDSHPAPSPSAEAAQPVADDAWFDGLAAQEKFDADYAKRHAQPQGELREAGIAFLNEVESVSGKVNKKHRDAFRAALAGRTAG